MTTNWQFIGHLRFLGTMLILAFLTKASCIHAQESQPAPIPEKEIAKLRDALSDNQKGASNVARRRSLKSASRKAQALVRQWPKAPNRFILLGIALDCQKRILAMEANERNRKALFKTCELLAQAPDDYAERRLEADLLLSEKRLSEKKATLKERAEALEDILERYRDTPAEAKSLLLGAVIVSKLKAPELENSILYQLDEKYSDDHEVIEFRRKHLKINRLDLTFRGEFMRLDGATIRFPVDTMGHLSLLVFWSKHTPGFKAYLEKTKEHLKQFENRLEVFSLNLDDLADGGKSILNGYGLDWSVLHLPGGRNHQAYRTYAHGDPVAVLVNEYGMSVIHPEIVYGRAAVVDASRASDERYTAQLQSLFIGDFLVRPPREGPAKEDENLKAVQACFSLAPMRYRLSTDEALASYKKAEALCIELLKKPSSDAIKSKLLNRLLVARLGIWNLACDPSQLKAAVAEATAALEKGLANSEAILPRYCIAWNAIRRSDGKDVSMVPEFLKACGGDDAPARALAAATILALGAKSRELFETYREAFLKKHADDPKLYELTAFLQNRHHQYRLLRANYTRRERGTRGYIVNHGRGLMTDPFPAIELKGLDGKTIALPKQGADRITLLMFLEPPVDPKADFPVRLDRRGKPTKDDPIRMLVRAANDVESKNINKSVEVVLAFLCDDAERAKNLMTSNEWKHKAAIVPNGLHNPMVRKLGILSADRIPNIFLIRRDGTIAWKASGLPYQTEFGYPWSFGLAMKVHTEACDLEHGYQLLKTGRYKEAVKVFEGPYEPWHPDRFGWRSARYHGKALALLALKDYKGAAEAIDGAIDGHRLLHFRGMRRSKSALDWRKDAQRVKMKHPCNMIALLSRRKATILEKMGLTNEAATLRKQFETTAEDYENLYQRFQQKLETLEFLKE